MRAFLAAIEREERERLTLQLALLVTASRGGSAEIADFLRELNRSRD